MRSLKVNTVSSTWPSCSLCSLLVNLNNLCYLVTLLLKVRDKDHNLIAISYSVAEITDQFVLNVGRLAFNSLPSFTFDCRI